MDDDRWDRYREEVRYRDPYLEPPPTWADRFERILIQLVNLGLVLLVATLLIMTQPQIRRAVVLLERLEGAQVGPGGQPVWQQAPGSTGGPGTSPAPQGPAPPVGGGSAAVPATVTLAPARISLAVMTRARAPEARLVVGDRVAGDFAAGRVDATVRAGEAVVVDGTRISEGLTFRVVAADGFLRHLLGREVTTRGDRAVLVSPGEP